MPIKNLSFVIIAHNEEFALPKCLSSIERLDRENCEVICIDSGSNDNTQAVAIRYQDKIEGFKLLHITGEQNASIARNAGLREASKNFVFFIDGDIEINSTFIHFAIDRLEREHTDAVFGQLDDYEYNASYSTIERVVKNRTDIQKETFRYLCGGIFIVKRSVAMQVGFFDEDFVKCEDFDYTLRITKKHRLLAVPIPMGIHHTVPYTEKSRMRNEIKNKLAVFYGAVLRKNHTHIKGCYAHIKKAGYLKGLFVLFLFASSVTLPQLLLPASMLIVMDIILGLKKKQNITFRLLSHYQMPIYVIYGFIFGIDKPQDWRYKIKRLV